MEKWTFAIGMMASLAAFGCAEEADGPAMVRIAPTIETRVTGLHFDEGDCIGLTIAQPGGNYVENRMLRYDGTAFTAEGLVWYDDPNEASTLTAYYPYAAAGAPASFAVAADQSGGCEASDLLAAVKPGVTPGSAPVAMTFKHLLSQLTVVVTNQTASAVTAVRFGGLVAEADVELSTLSATEVTACEVEAGARYRAILVPQEADLVVTVETEDGKSRSKTLTGVQLAAGYRYDLAITVEVETIAVTLSGEIEGWSEGGALGGEEAGGTDSGGDGTDTGEGGTGDDTSAGTLEYEGVSYPTATVGNRVWMAANLRVMPAGATLGSGVWKPSEATDAGLLYTYATATNGVATAADAPVRGICPEGWHIPLAEELELLTTADAGFFRNDGYQKYTADSYSHDTGKGYLMGAPLNADGRVVCLAFGEGVTTAVTNLRAEYGISVRCIRDAE